MLNYVWYALIILGLSAAIYTDVSDLGSDAWNNDKSLSISVEGAPSRADLLSHASDIRLIITPEAFKSWSGKDLSDTIRISAKSSPSKDGASVSLYMIPEKSLHPLITKMASVNGKENDLLGTLTLRKNSDALIGSVKFERISFVKMKEVTASVLSYAETAVTIALGLIGIMALWLGVMKVAEEGGLIAIIAKAVKPITKFLYPDVPSDHPAMGAMIMNFSANFLGLGNAATPFGLKAMEELDKLNPEKGTATNAMCTFLAINTAGMTLIPATAIAIRASVGSSDPAIIIGTSLFGSTCATTVAILSAKLFENFPMTPTTFFERAKKNLKGFALFFAVIFMLFAGIMSGAFSYLFSWVSVDFIRQFIQLFSIAAIPLLILIFLSFGFVKKVKVYETFVEGAKEGFNIAVRIIPYLVAMLAAIGIFRAGGAMEWLIYGLTFITDPIGMPAEALPMALMRPLSGSGSLGIMTEIITIHGPDSFIGILVSTFFGSSETTFYVLAVYFGSVGIKKTRHALPAGLLADAAGFLGALFIVKLLFG